MRRLLRPLVSICRGPKKKGAVEVEASTDYINIFKEKKDPVFSIILGI
jgi:hypothetical protein